ncbi:hypothetical protein CLAIMM_05656 [Cladophialophora immunda]|nr:hypothetical protein CLAIMM_05656 [Cladophialophora immunda]
MDVLSCATITAGEVYLLKNFHQLDPTAVILLILCLAQYFVLKFYRIYIVPRYLSPLRHLPGPTNDHFLIGQAYNFFNSGPAEAHLSWMRQFPDAPVIRFLSVGNSEGILLNSVKATRDVLQTQCYKFVKPSFMRRVLGEIIGTGLFFEEGEAHKRQRRLLTVPFSYGTIKGLLPFFDTKAQELASLIETLADSRPNDLIEVSSLFSKTALDIIGLACLGIQMNNLSSPSEFAMAYEKVFENTAWSAIMSALNIYLPIRSLIPIKTNRDYLNANATIRRLLRQHIRQRKVELEGQDKESSNGKDVLSIMIKERGTGAEIWDEDEMLGHLLNFMAAGHETSAGSLTLALYVLAHHPEIQARLRKEILEHYPPNAQLDAAGIEKSTYLRNFTSELFRYYAPGIIAHREAAEDVVVDGVLVPQGTLVHIVPAVIHHNPRIWGTTVEDFNPDRWEIGLPEEAQDSYAWGSFLNGPRVCIGKSFAILEFKTIMIHLLRTFTFNDPANVPLKFERGAVSLRPEGGMHLKIERLSSESKGFEK